MALSSLIPTALVALLLSAVQVNAHGIATALVVYPGGASSGTYYKGYNPSYQYQSPAPAVAAWSTPDDLDNGFVTPANFGNGDIVCHRKATPGALAVPVNAGDVLAVKWDTWPESHKGPILDSLANCNGPCQNVDKTKLEFFHIGQLALIDVASDFWAPNQLIKNDFTWLIKIPKSIAPGNYVLRHEIIGLHAAGQPNGAQAYPFCFNLAISSSGSEKPKGESIVGMYDANEPGIVFDLFRRQTSYPMPGGTLWSGAESISQTKAGAVAATGTAITSLVITAVAPPTTTSSAAPVPVTTTSTTPKSTSTSTTSTTPPPTTSTPSPPSSAPAVAEDDVFITTLVLTQRVTVTTHFLTTLTTTVRRVQGT